MQRLWNYLRRRKQPTTYHRFLAVHLFYTRGRSAIEP